jgi:tripartite-type tricarboxylate transporter receptor subunit TctC
MITKRRFLSIGGAGALCVVAPGSWHRARAQAVRGTVRIIVGFPPGGPVDIVARLLVAEMKDYAAPIGMTKLSFEIASSKPVEFAALIKSSTERWGPIVAASGFRAED